MSTAKRKTILLLFLLGLVLPGSAMAQEASFTVKNVSYELGDQFDGEKGLVFHVEVTIHNNLGKVVNMKGIIQYKDSQNNWKGVPRSNRCSGYVDNDNFVLAKAKTRLNCSYQDSYKSDYQIFVPYDAFTHPSGDVSYRLGLFMTCDNSFLKTSSGSYYHYYYFSLNWPSSYTTRINSSTSSSSSSSGSNTKKYPYTEKRGNTSFTYYADGRIDTTSEYDCGACAGGGNCLNCHGTGRIMFMNMFYPCPLCGGLGKCMYCRGLGKIVSTTTTYSNQNYNTGASAGVYSGGGYSGYSGNSGGSSSNSAGSDSRPCPKCNGAKKCYPPSGSVGANQFYCFGSGRCGVCGGDGKVYSMGSYSTCTTCGGTGRCASCGGSGVCSRCNGSGRF